MKRGLAILVAGWLATGAVAAEPTSESAVKKQEPAAAPPIEQLVRQLGDKDYPVRQRAQEELARRGFEAFDALNAATTDEDLEIASRAKYLLRLMRVEWTLPSDPPEVKKCLQEYEFEDAHLRQARMQLLVGLPQGQGIAALCRLVRFEKSSMLSKMAAVAFLKDRQAGEIPSPELVEVIRKSLQGCNRPGATWLLAWTRLSGSPEREIAEWDRLIAAECRMLKQGQNESDSEIVAGLTKFQVGWLKKLGKNDAAAAAIARLVALERGDPETLLPLLEWLIEEKAWKSLDDVSRRFPARFAAEPALLYLLAQAYAEQGNKDRAEETASRALGLHGGKQNDQLLRHLRIATYLKNRGLFAWARREFEAVIQRGGAEGNEPAVMAQTLLAEMFHDQGADKDAAATMERLVKALDAGKVTEAELYGRRPAEIRARMHYFFACDAAAKNEDEKQRQLLDKAFEADPADVDVLIACYRLPGQPPEYRAKIVEQIAKTAAQLREEIAADPDVASTYNQFAWLIGNTEGNFDEAIQASWKSLELQPNEAGYYDTLAHAYAGKGDWENAVKYQTKAAELDPHSGLVQRELALFRKKLAEKKKT